MKTKKKAATKTKTRKRKATALQIDPTRTTTLRNRFVRQINVRFARIVRELRKLIVEEDAFGLIERREGLIANNRFAFMTDAQKVQAFRDWLQALVDQGILEVTGTGEAWTNEFIESAYKKAVVRGYIEANRYDAITDPFFKGNKEAFLTEAFAAPTTTSKLELLYTRTYNNLKGVTDEMSNQLSRTLAEGLARGDHPNTVAREMQKRVGTLTKTRARAIARTETIYAHNEGLLDSFERSGIKEVGAMVEWSTAEDDRVCPLCNDLNAVVMTIQEARGIMPRHPNCRCSWLPANVGESTKGQKRSKSAIQKAIAKSIKSEHPKLTLKEAKAKTKWVGADTKISKKRPAVHNQLTYRRNVVN